MSSLPSGSSAASAFAVSVREAVKASKPVLRLTQAVASVPQKRSGPPTHSRTHRSSQRFSSPSSKAETENDKDWPALAPRGAVYRAGPSLMQEHDTDRRHIQKLNPRELTHFCVDIHFWYETGQDQKLIDHANVILKCVPFLRAPEVSMCAHHLARVNFDSRTWWEKFATSMMKHMVDADPKDLALILNAFAHVRFRPPAELMEALCNEIMLWCHEENDFIAAWSDVGRASDSSAPGGPGVRLREGGRVEHSREEGESVSPDSGPPSFPDGQFTEGVQGGVSFTEGVEDFPSSPASAAERRLQASLDCDSNSSPPSSSSSCSASERGEGVCSSGPSEASSTSLVKAQETDRDKRVFWSMKSPDERVKQLYRMRTHGFRSGDLATRIPLLITAGNCGLTLNSLGRLQYFHFGVLETLCNRIEKVIWTANGLDVSGIIGALSKLEFADVDMLSLLAERVVQTSSVLEIQHCTTILNAFSRQNFQHPEAVDALLQRLLLLSKEGAFSPEQLSKLMAAFGRHAKKPEQLVELIRKEGPRQLSKMSRPSDLSTTAVAMSRLGLDRSVDPSLFLALGESLEKQLKEGNDNEWDAQSISTLCVALMRLQLQTEMDMHLWAHLMRLVEPRLSAMGGEDLSLVALAFSSLPPPTKISSSSTASTYQPAPPPSSTPTRPHPPEAPQRSSSPSPSPSRTFNPLSTRILAKVAHRVPDLAGEMTPMALARTASAFEQGKVRKKKVLWALCVAAARGARRFPPKDAACMVSAIAALDFQNEVFFAILGQHLASCLGRLTAHQRDDVARAFLRAEMVPPSLAHVVEDLLRREPSAEADAKRKRALAAAASVASEEEDEETGEESQRERLQKEERETGQAEDGGHLERVHHLKSMNSEPLASPLAAPPPVHRSPPPPASASGGPREGAVTLQDQREREKENEQTEALGRRTNALRGVRIAQ
eukprot:Cvel_5277.t1-p1 / transcript=Cvel_5277.t1 / gene=Cvel_5277 / organism=Chromera_velia_CCMP2878 / gene_product=hypothetical protein / transcript_product=hypothetical protein / location=Cvel_scaffold244:443-9067(-) / protein_length=945 / sequence_SO=supercontig / SO=protein_coding / is_pseudo=false